MLRFRVGSAGRSLKDDICCILYRRQRRIDSWHEPPSSLCSVNTKSFHVRVGSFSCLGLRNFSR